MASKLAMKDINFLPLINKKTKISRLNRRARGVLIAMGAVVLILGALFGLYMGKVNEIEARKAEFTAYLWNEQTVAAFGEAKQMLDAQLLLQAKAGQLSAMLGNIAAQNRLGSRDFNAMLNMGGGAVTIQEFNYNRDEGIVEARFNALAPTDIAPFVGKLSTSGMFSSVLYTGYEQDFQQRYQFTVVFYLKGGEDNV